MVTLLFQNAASYLNLHGKEQSIAFPNGLLILLILEEQLILQQPWKIPSNLNNRCLKWLQTLKHMEKVRLPRWYGSSFKNIKNIELHPFADASLCAYGQYLIFVLYKNIKLNVGLLLRSRD